jgi:hypothetical protein
VTLPRIGCQDQIKDREYANKQQMIGDQRVSVIKDYANHYDTIDDVKADE